MQMNCWTKSRRVARQFIAANHFPTIIFQNQHGQDIACACMYIKNNPRSANQDARVSPPEEAAFEVSNGHEYYTDGSEG